jgi:hypothetical protein
VETFSGNDSVAIDAVIAGLLDVRMADPDVHQPKGSGCHKETCGAMYLFFQ